MNKTLIGVLCSVAAVVLLLIPTGNSPQPPTPNPSGNKEVTEAFATYQRLWIDLGLKAAEKLDSKEFTTDAQVYEYLAAGQEPARKIAFDSIAKKEQEALGEGKWTPELHSSILKGYSK